MWLFGLSAFAAPPVALDPVIGPYRDALVLAAAAPGLDGDRLAEVPILGELLMHERDGAEASLQAALLADVPRERRDKGKRLAAFLAELESDRVRDADRLAFTSVLDALNTALASAPAGKARDALLARVGEDQTAIAGSEALYREEMRKILGQLGGTRGVALTRERWDAYLAAIQADRPLDAIFARHADELGGGAAASRGLADNPYEIYGTALPDKTFALTFDDGPDPVQTAAILDILAARGIKATFFEVGQNVGTEAADGSVAETPAAAMTHRIVAEGHQLGNHTWSHANLPKLSDAQIADQIDKSDRVLHQVAGRAVDLFRPPYGSRDQRVLDEIVDRSERAFLWNVDSRDWADPIPESIAQSVYDQVTKVGHGIILMHDVHPQTVAALPTILDLLAKDGYQLVLWDGDRVVPNPSAPPKVAAGPSALYAQSWAVVVGIDQYQHWPRLAYAVHDAEGVRDELVGQFGFPKDHVITLLDGDATRQRVLGVLGDELPAKVGPDDRVFVFWAGHGATRELPGGGQRGYLVPVDADTTSLQTGAISMTELQDVQEALAAKHVWFVTDACYSGLALTRGGTAAYDPQRYLAEITHRRARQILTAGGADEQVADHGPNGHSIFTYTLLQGMDGAADLNGDGYVTASELGSYVAPRVSSLSKQTPAFGSLVGSEGGDFVLELREELLSEASTPTPADPSALQRARSLLAAENDELKQQLAAMRDELERFRGQRGLAPDDPKADAARLHALGLASYRDGRLAEAVEAIQKAADLDPTDVEILNNLGFLRQKLGDHAAAVPCFQQAVALDPDRAVAYVNLGDSLAALGRADDAVAAYRRYLALFPDSPLRGRVVAYLDQHP